MGSFVYRFHPKSYPEIPTSVCWISENKNNISISYISPIIWIFDRITGKWKDIINYEGNYSGLTQANKIWNLYKTSLIISGH